MQLLSILMAAILTENVVLVKFLGICPFLGVSKKLKTAVGMSGAVLFVMLMATAVTWPVNTWVLIPFGLEYLQTVVFILVIASLVQLVEIVLKKQIPALYRSLGIFLPLITTNCAVLGVTLLNFDKNLGFMESLFNAAGTGLGFLLALILFAGVRERLESCKVPRSLEGIPIALIAAAIVSLSFLGFSGLAENIFG